MELGRGVTALSLNTWVANSFGANLKVVEVEASVSFEGQTTRLDVVGMDVVGARLKQTVWSSA
ncbi:hypothetical protein BS297_06075 [Rhodococcus erythropolis]|uniref:Uncharacterized protein n=1 Tax=Rhodococcus erythropolis TaxID=1833 RepID=A0A0C3A8I1_RHOER|nr:hypothetical protein BS297_06075 [Rhodococcus erythropolis]KIM15681.1 hypothetical protein QV65_21030 [Rhodococcus erythropolis]